jgi:tRNA G10  N-methylase Trm11
LQDHPETPNFIYTFACQEDEISLFRLEQRSLFGVESSSPLLKSTCEIDPSRSPFIRERIEVMYEGDDLPEITEQAGGIRLPESTTFKVRFVKTNDLDASEKIEYEQQRAIEREIGWRIGGEADVHKPDQVFGVVTLGRRWYLGRYSKNRSVWLHHMQKPQNYSMALPTRIARAVVNIAVPNPSGLVVIDPCCGIGTVLVEALSMGIDIVGRDLNPLAAIGARKNIAHFGLRGEVMLGSIADVSSHYDVAIIDMPYNLVSRITPEAQLSILAQARRIADKVVVISIEAFDDRIASAGFTIADRCVVRKGSFARHIMVCI